MDKKLCNLFPGPSPQVKRNLSAAAGAESYSCEFGSTTYYAYCGLGGLLSCGITHTMVTPLDLVKCRLQVRANTNLTFQKVGSLKLYVKK